MPAWFELPLGHLPFRVLMTTRAAGDLRPGSEGSAERRTALWSGPAWSVARQVHGASVAEAASSGDGVDADAVVGTGADRLAVFAADCALIGVASPQGFLAAVHAGWGGLLAGVVEAAAAELRRRGASTLLAVRGPLIGPECYEFGASDLARVAARYGDCVRNQTASGAPALDLGAAVRAACQRAGIELVHEVDSCTGCARTAGGEPLWFSHRARSDAGRHALVVTGAA